MNATRRADRQRDSKKGGNHEACTAGSGNSRLSVGFILARNFTLSAFASFVDVLRLSADDGDSSRQILCSWNVLSSDRSQIRSSCGVPLQPDAKMGDPRDYDYIVVVGGLLDQVEDLDSASLAYLHEGSRAECSACRSVYRRVHPTPRWPDAGAKMLH